VGPATPIVATLDLHANVTALMARTLDVMLGVHLNPHTDMHDRGAEAVRMLPDLVAGRRRPVTHVEPLPMLLPLTTTDLGPAADVNVWCGEVEQRPGIIDCTFFHGFPYSDGHDVGARVVCIADDDLALARAAAREVAAYVWSRREDFRPAPLSPEAAVMAALDVAEGPVVINDTSDNPGGGTMGDDVQLLRAMVDAGVERACFGFICDAETVAAAHAAGVGSSLDVELGGKSDRRTDRTTPDQRRRRDRRVPRAADLRSGGVPAARRRCAPVPHRRAQVQPPLPGRLPTAGNRDHHRRQRLRPHDPTHRAARP
jgi:microcystin degradation protein MlrC